MKNIKKIVSLMLTTALFISLLVACGGTSSNTNSIPNVTSSIPVVTKLQKFNPPVEITTARWVDPAIKYIGSDSWTDNAFTRWLNKNYGITIKDTWSVQAYPDFAQKVRLSMSSGDKLPDVLYCTSNDLSLIDELIQSGQVQDIKGSFDQYATDIVKNAYNVAPAAWNRFKSGDKLMGIPMLSNGVGNTDLFFIRQDWLEKSGLAAPKTIADLDVFFDAVVNKDLDGNGKKDTIGVALGLKNSFCSWISSSDWLFGAYGAMPEYFYKKDGKLVYGSVQPEIKNALIKLKEWIAKGFVSSEAAMTTEGDAAALIYGAGKSAILPGATWAGGGWPTNDPLIKAFPNAKVDAIPLPVGPDGKQGRKGYAVENGGFLFSKDFKNMNAFMVYLNAMYESYNNENPLYKDGIVEGGDYIMKAGTALYGPDKEAAGGYIDNYFKTFMFGYDYPTIPNKDFEIAVNLSAGKAPVTAKERKVAKGYFPLESKAMGIVLEQKDNNYYDLFNGIQTPTMKTKWAQLQKTELQTYMDIVYNKKPIEAFDTFVADWNKNGGEQILKEINDTIK